MSTQAEKEAAKALKEAEKAAAQAEKEAASDEIIVGDPQELRPVELPLVVRLPEGASKAQVKFASILNAYAYKNPTKWAIKKDTLIAQLEALKNAPDPVEDNLTIGKKNIIS